MALNVLVVDDSSVMRAMVIKIMQLSGLPLAHVHQAGNGREALACLAQHRVDLVLLDLNMPVMDGMTTLSHIRQNPATADLPVVVVSTEGSDARIGALRQQGAAFVHKPFSPEVLRQVMVTITGVRDEQRMEHGPATGHGPDF